MMTQEKLSPQKFAKLGKYQKLEIIYGVQFNILEEIGKIAALAQNLDMKYEGLKQQLDLLLNQDFLKQQVKESQAAIADVQFSRDSK